MKILQNLLDTIAPNLCLICEREGQLMCDWCFPDAFEPVPSRCAFCLRVSEHSAVCQRCCKQTPLRQVWVGTVYKGVAKDLVKHMKFHPDRTACTIIARQLDEIAPHLANTVVSYVPTARVRVRQRGFDHAELIAREFARLRQLPCKKLVQRQGSLRQVGSEKKQRVEQVSGVYQSIGRSPTSVVLVDDIMTTGATLSEVARTLKKSGARQVCAMAFAQTI